VTNEDSVSLLAEFGSGITATFESSRAIIGPESQNAFEVYGTEGAVAWDFESMNELRVYRRSDRLDSGWTTVYGGERFPYHGAFVPGSANGIGFEDLVTIEDHEFLSAVAEGRAFVPGFAQAADFAAVQSALMRSWASGGWEDVAPAGSRSPAVSRIPAVSRSEGP
jgi:predicted dehydrogenase